MKRVDIYPRSLRLLDKLTNSVEITNMSFLHQVGVFRFDQFMLTALIRTTMELKGGFKLP